MATQNKVKLQVAGKWIGSLEALRNNFFLNEILELYHSGDLAQWLLLAGFQNEYEQVVALNGKENISLSRELAKIFKVNCEKEHIKLMVAKMDRKSPPYTYSELLDEICKINTLKKVDTIKALIELLIKNYYDEYKANKMQIFERFVNKAPLAAVAILNNPNAFKPFLPAILRYNHVDNEQDVSPADIEELSQFSALLEKLANKNHFCYGLLYLHFPNITMYSEEPSQLFDLGYYPFGTLRKLVLIGSSNYVVNTGIDFSDIFAQFAIININDIYELNPESSDQVFLAIDLMSHEITEPQWDGITQRWYDHEEEWF